MGDLKGEQEDIKKVIRSCDSAVIAFSGGVDSTLVAVMSQKILNKKAVMVTVISEFTKSGEVEYAQKIAKRLNLRHKILKLDILNDMQIIANTSQRCYHCKKKIMKAISIFASEKGIAAIFDGSNYSDLLDDRPGLQALRELGVISPLLVAKVSKAQVRRFAALLRLPNYNKARQSCLATRVALNQLITINDLKRIDEAENYIQSLGFPVVRVRVEKDKAVIQTYIREISRLVKHRQAIVDKLKTLGFSMITIDMEGYPEEMFEW
jgi:pyridinium-3,5-biscarboxylic acid mononucleotide sulfurtransferase